jgi:hypothetical protein
MEKCEICGKEATCGVRDVSMQGTIDGHVKLKQYGKPHFYCIQHNRPSRTIKITESPIIQILKYEASKNRKKSNETIQNNDD